MTSRRSGKSVVLIRRAVETNGVIFTVSKASQEHLIATSIKLGLKPPKVVVLARGRVKGITIAGLFDDHR